MKKIIALGFVFSLLVLNGCSFFGSNSASKSEESAASNEASNEAEVGTASDAEPTEELSATPPPETSVAAAASVKAQVKAQVKLAPRTIAVADGYFFFKPNALKLKLNQPVTINFANKGTHTFTVDELGVNAALAGPTGSVSFTPKKKGTFRVYCAIPGHVEGGMIGTVTVE